MKSNREDSIESIRFKKRNEYIKKLVILSERPSDMSKEQYKLYCRNQKKFINAYLINTQSKSNYITPNIGYNLHQNT